MAGTEDNDGPCEPVSRNSGAPPVVGIGASAGGIKALQEFFEAMPVDAGLAFVVIVHLAPERHSELPHILAARTRMPVVQVNAPMALAADHVYVIPPDRQIEISQHHVAAEPFEDPRGQRAPIDWFFRSLACQHGDGFAVILTGAGSDGTIGLKAVKEAGGIILVQDPREAEFGSMPRSAIATGLADFVLPLREMAGRLVELVHAKAHLTPERIQAAGEDYTRRILDHVRARTGHDFIKYKKSTIARRIARRMQVSRKDKLADYFTYLQENVEEVQALFGDMLISVTTFFRDFRSFQVLADVVVPKLFAGKQTSDTIRVWVPGCASGEEAYSIAILLLEEAAKQNLHPALQVFGSDLDAGGLAVAREGRYPASIATDISEERLHRYFVREANFYQARRELRNSILFASHSLLKDPPFGRLDLISCRNLLIYLDRDLQQQACAIFHYALNPDGFLFLGSTENADSPPGLFSAIDKEVRIYQSKGRPSGMPFALPKLLGTARREPPFPRQPYHAPIAAAAAEGAQHRQGLETAAPPSILVDEMHRVIHLSETAGRFLEPPLGILSSDITELVRREMRFDLRAALTRAFVRAESSMSLSIIVQFDGRPHRVYLHVKPILQEGKSPVRQALAFFLDGGAVEAAVGGRPDDPTGEGDVARETIRQLREDLHLTQSLLRSTRDESEATTDELRPANEELQSINEEYRSTSEELETSKEELQSINEELQTVNAELKIKLEAVSRAHGDLQNLMAATDFGVLFLDTALRIKRFTPRVAELFNVTAADEGRPIGDFTHQLAYDGLVADTSDVLRDLKIVEREIGSHAGRWYLMRLRPYRTVENRIDGVVLTFVDVTERRAAEDALRQSEERLRQMTQLVEMSGEPICVWELEEGVVEWNRGSERLFGYLREEVLGRDKHSLLATAVPGTSFAEIERRVLAAGSWTGEVLHTTKDGRSLTVETRVEYMPVDGRRLILETSRDVSDRKIWEGRQQLLLSELTHRVKNTLTVVQSIAHQTLRSNRNGEEFGERFDGRLAALARAHMLLVESDWQGAELAALAHNQLEPYATDHGDRLRIEGAPVILPANLATPFGLILHELATNAAKHGSWSVNGGSVHLSWCEEGDGPDRLLTMVWREHDGPRVEAPQATGFGGRLIRNGLPDAIVAQEFLPDGVVCTITLPLPQPEAPVADA